MPSEQTTIVLTLHELVLESIVPHAATKSYAHSMSVVFCKISRLGIITMQPTAYFQLIYWLTVSVMEQFSKYERPHLIQKFS